MSFIKSRLRRIEETVRGGPCPEGKLSPDGPGYIVYEEGEERPQKADERCGACGRRLWFVIKVVEDAWRRHTRPPGAPHRARRATRGAGP